LWATSTVPHRTSVKFGEIGFDLDNNTNTTVISMNINAGAVDSEIELTGLHNLTQTMFIL
jgi:hypothetical protein